MHDGTRHMQLGRSEGKVLNVNVSQLRLEKAIMFVSDPNHSALP